VIGYRDGRSNQELKVTKYELVRLPRTLRGVGEHTKRDGNQEARIRKVNEEI